MTKKTKDNQEEKSKINIKIIEKDNRKNLESKDTSHPYMNQNILKLCIWMLLIAGLCIIVTTFYVVILQIFIDVSVATPAEQVLESCAAMSAVPIIEDASNSFDELSIIQNSVTTARSVNYTCDTIEEHLNRCRTTCANVANISIALNVCNDNIENSLCSSVDILLLVKQAFPEDALKHYWLNFNISVGEFIISFSKIVTIKSNTFNSSLFKDTVTLSSYHMNIVNVESCALLGLFRLKYLTIQCHLEIYANKNPFGEHHFNNLVYLDLSNNIFNGSLSKNFFKSTPNLKYLIIVNSGIQHIEEDAFENLIEKLLFINLSKNLLTTLAAGVFQPILISRKNVMINLSKNSWICNCQLDELAKLYKLHYLQFIDILYCMAPHHLYGMSLDKVDFRQEKCLLSGTRVQDPLEEKATFIFSSNITLSNTHQGIDTKNGSSNSTEKDLTENQNMLKMHRFDGLIPKKSEDLLKDELKNSRTNFDYPALNSEFKLELVPENNSVIVSIGNINDIFVIWFSQHLETSVTSNGNTSFDYECMRYYANELLVGPLQENTTYTFCLWSSAANDIFPSNCLPLYVPPKVDENIWISEKDKNFTIGILCLIFLLSAVAGALIAYFGFRKYPDLLECCRNILVVEDSDNPCYVVTISETEYQKQSSLKRRKSFTKQDNLNKLTLSDTLSGDISPTPYCMSGNDLERLSGLNSSSTCVDDTIAVCCFASDEYETPKVCNEQYTVEQRNAPSANNAIPRSPPPLPKRNSSTSNSFDLNSASSI